MTSGYRQPDNTPSVTYNASSFTLGDKQQTAMQCDVNGKLLVNAGTITASLGGFTPSGTYTTPLAVSNVSASTAINGADPVQMLTNVGSVTVYVNLGGSGVTATTSDIPISAGASVALTVGTNTYIAAITASNTSTLNIAGGSGLLTGIAGSPSVSGSNPAAGSTGSAVPSSASYGGVNVAGTLRGQTGVNPSGTVYAAQGDLTSVGGTTVSASGGVQNVSAVLTAGAAKIGQVAIDQTTPGATNAVDVTNLPVTVDTGSGNSSASTIRVVVATNQATLPISAASLPLPTGAATAAKQPALGTAGTASTDVLTVQGIVSMTALKVDGSGVTQPVSAASLPLPTGAATSANQPTNCAIGSATSGETGTLMMGAVTSAAPSYTTAQTNPLSLDLAGNLRVNVVAGGAGGGAVFGPTAVGSAAANPPVLIAGTANAGATGNVQVAKVSATGLLSVDGSGVTQPVSGTVTANAGTNLNTSALALETGGNLATIAGAITASVAQANVKQINGVAPLMGNGVTGTGSQRVTIASNSTSISQWGQGATGSAVPPNAVLKGTLAKTALPAAGSDGNLAAAMADKFGRQITRSAPRELLVTIAKRSTGTSGSFLTAQGANVFADPYRFVIANSSTVALLVSLLDGTNTYPFEAPAQSTVGFSGPASDATPAATANTAWTYTISSSSTKVFMHGQFILNK